LLESVRGSTTPTCCVLSHFPCLCLLESIHAAEWNRDVDYDGRVIGIDHQVSSESVVVYGEVDGDSVAKFLRFFCHEP
jgi:hypothetical protein